MDQVAHGGRACDCVICVYYVCVMFSCIWIMDYVMYLVHMYCGAEGL